MKTRTVAGATLFAAITIAQSSFATTTELPKLSDRKPAQASNEFPVNQIGCQFKGDKCASQPLVTESKDEEGQDIQIAVCAQNAKVVHATKLKYCHVMAPAML